MLILISTFFRKPLIFFNSAQKHPVEFCWKVKRLLMGDKESIQTRLRV